MTQALAERPALPKEQIDLIRKTVANGATDTELQLFLYDCARRGIHPLDKLLHFTKRGGKYTPVTSIDFMRSQAAATGEMAGSDDPVFEFVNDSHPDSARVTVYRLTQGHKYAYTATARWSEYCPDNAPMWKRMPHTMLGKCAEALALRKAFPQQLAGLYAREELDQAEKSGYAVEAPVSALVGKSESRASDDGLPSNGAAIADAPWPSVPNGGDIGQLYIASVNSQPTKNANVTKYVIVLSDGREVTTIKTQLAALCEQLCQEKTPIAVETKATKWGEDLLALHRVEHVEMKTFAPITADDLSF